MKNILITGANGFIGSFLAEEGIKLGYQVFASVRATSKTEYLKDKNIQIFTLNLDDKSKLIRDFKEFSQKGIHFHYFIHNAGITKAVNKKDFLKVNYQYTKNLVEALIESDCIPEKFVYMSSLEAYGHGNEKTMEPVRETDTPKPFSRYGKSKLKSEQYLKCLKDFPYLIIRPTGVYGPREKDYFIYIKAIKRGFEFYIGRKKQHLSFVYVKDLVRFVYTGIESQIVNRSYFVTDGKTYTSNDLAKNVKDILGKKCLKIVIPKIVVRWISTFAEPISHMLHKQTVLNPDKYQALTSTNWLCNSDKIKEDFDFVANYDLKKGMKETIDWYRSNHWI
ncbi:MAG: NAD(P)-dependent oxidoreductase [Bacteroidales bacterium]|nr:NAD(P)-dependent oxidoreductase [Bacteroidales bacterium]